jgi:tetratricopeptide (TPR) repeat protein
VSLPGVFVTALWLLEPSGALVAEAEAAFREQRWQDAAALFERAYEADPQPKFLWASAQAHRKAGRCDVATERLQTYVERESDPGRQALARDLIEVCAVESPESAPDPVGASTAPATAPATGGPEAPETDAAPPRPWYRDGWGAALAGTGAVGLIAGGIVYGVARAENREADRAATEADYGEHIERAEQLSRAGIAVIAVGGGLLTVAAVRWAIVGTRRTRLTAELSPRRAIVGVRLRF